MFPLPDAGGSVFSGTAVATGLARCALSPTCVTVALRPLRGSRRRRSRAASPSRRRSRPCSRRRSRPGPRRSAPPPRRRSCSLAVYMNWEESRILSKRPAADFVRRSHRALDQTSPTQWMSRPHSSPGPRASVSLLSARRPHLRSNAGTKRPQVMPSQSKMQTSSLLLRARRPRRHRGGPVVAEALADRPCLVAVPEPCLDLGVLDRVAVLVQDHVGVLGVVHAPAPVLDPPGRRRVEGVVVPERVRDRELGALVDPLRVAGAEPEALDVALGAIDVEVGHQGLEAVLRPLHAAATSGSACRPPCAPAADLGVHPLAAQAALSSPDVAKRRPAGAARSSRRVFLSPRSRRSPREPLFWTTGFGL